MMGGRFLPLEAIVFLYFLSYIPNILFTRLATSRVNPELGRVLTGLETLPASLLRQPRADLSLHLAVRMASRCACGTAWRRARARAHALHGAVGHRHGADPLHRAAVLHVHECQHSLHPAADARRHPADRAAGRPDLPQARALVELDSAGHRCRGADAGGSPARRLSTCRHWPSPPSCSTPSVISCVWP